MANPNSTAITCEEMTAAEAAANDNAAWYVTFNPKTCYYQLRNVGTGQYLTYNTSRNKFLTTNKETPTTAESFQFMRGRTDVNIGTGSTAVTARGYWIIRPEKTLNPHVWVLMPEEE